MNSIILVMLLAAATQETAHQSLEVRISKSVYLVGESSYFETTVQLQGSDGIAADPGDFDAAADQLSTGISIEVLEASKTSFRKACVVSHGCKVDSPSFWDNFIRQTQQHVIEPKHSLSEYLFNLDETLAVTWKLERSCDERAELCKGLRAKVDASPIMLAELIFRGALLKSLNSDADFCEIVAGMGEMVTKKEVGTAQP